MSVASGLIPMFKIGFDRKQTRTEMSQLSRRSINILSGGLGSDLWINGGLDRDKLNNDPLWSARLCHENPRAIVEVHLRFLNAGSNVLTTASYQASVQGYVDHLGVTEQKAEEIIGSTVDLARQAATEYDSNKKITVAGSITPYGAILHDMSEYTGSYIDTVSTEVLTNFHRTNIRILASKGADILACETLPSSGEALIIANLLTEFPNAKAWITFTSKDGLHTSYGDPFEDTLKALSKYEQVVAVGLNCVDSSSVPAFLKLAEGNLGAHQSVIVYPDNRKNFKSTALTWLDDVETWLNSDLIGWIGGCCLVKPNDITSVKAVVDRWQNRHQ